MFMKHLAAAPRFAVVLNVLLAAAFVRSASGAAAKKSVVDPCAHPPTEAALLSCRQKEHKRLEDQVSQLEHLLNGNYERDEPELAKIFSAAQSKWRDFRELECKVLTHDSLGGTAYESIWLDCLTKLNQERVTKLQWLKDHP